MVLVLVLEARYADDDYSDDDGKQNLPGEDMNMKGLKASRRR